MAKDELSFDLEGLQELFSSKNLKKLNNEKVAMWALLVAVMLLVFWVRMQPAALPVAEDWAENSIQQGVRNQVSQQITQQYPSLPDENRNQLIDEQVQQFMQQNAGAIEQQKQQMAEQLRQRLRYDGPDGEEYTYLGDLDSYFWIRYTRNWLETGMVCDEITPEGECWDTHVLAPIGQGTGGWNPSTHVFVIGWLHKLITTFNPGYPLPATSFLVPVLAGMLGVIPAFFIGRKLAGNVAGVFAGVLISLSPLLLSRSMGSDNDVWNVVVPLFIIWAAVEALDAEETWKKAAYGTATGLLIGVYSTFWAGWWFIYLIILFGFLGSLGFMIVRHAVRERDWQVWKDAGVKALGVVFICFYVAAMVIPVATDVRTVSTYVTQPLVITSSGANLDRAVAQNYWPNVLTTVAELRDSSFGEAVGQMGGKTLFFLCLLGMLLMIMPRQIRKWTWEHYALLTLGAFISIYLLRTGGLSRLATLALLALPIGIIILLDLWRGYKVDVTVALIILVWFLATVYATYTGIRFILLMIPAFGIGIGVTAGRAFEWITGYANRKTKLPEAVTYAIVFLVLMTILVSPVKAGHGTARGFVPTISDAWWDTLVNIRESSSEDAIINSWWDFGHWFKYIAERRVTADGTTQGTHVPRWLGLSLVTPDERESVGVLRMLNCGSDAFPVEEGWEGAYGHVLNRTDDPLRSERIVRELVVRDEEEARTYLEGEGFSSPDIDDILSRTHCPPVEDYFITSGDMVGKAGVWAHFGLWDFDRAYAAETARSLPVEEAVPLIAERMNVSEDEANRIYFEILSLPDEGQVNAWISPWPGYITGNWRACQAVQNGTMTGCNLQLGIGNQNNVVTSIESFLYFPEDEENSTMVIGFRQGGQLVQSQFEPPSRLIIADNTSLREVETNGTGQVNVGVLLDTVHNRVLLSDPRLLDSMFTQLFFLEGRYNEHFERFDDRTTFSGLRVLTWKVDWDG